MKPRIGFDWIFARGWVHGVMLRSASLLVPRQQRSEWIEEWRGELWHVRQACASPNGSSPRGAHAITAFCLGAFQDALCLRRAGCVPSGDETSPIASRSGTARQCLLRLSALLVAGYAIALLLPGVGAERGFWPREGSRNLVVIEREEAVQSSRPNITAAQFKAWQGRRQRYFDGIAFYGVEQMPVERETTERQSAAGERAEWVVGRPSANLFAVLGLHIRFDDAAMRRGEDLLQIVLGEAAWKQQFRADPHVAGQLVRLGRREARIAGVVADGSFGLPGQVDVWEIDPEPANGLSRSGFVVAHLTPLGVEEMSGQWVQISANAPDGAEEDFWGASIDKWNPAPPSIYLFGLFLALLALPAITAVSLGDASVNPRPASWSRRLLGWSFLSTKIALLLASIYFLSLDAAYGCTLVGSDGAVYLQLASCFAMGLFGFRWVLKDQRQRCPVCLRQVVHPAQVGQASRTFLDWNGTEMMCAGGHTLLHVPSLPTSWFGAQRWLYLDTSWGFLFVPGRNVP